MAAKIAQDVSNELTWLEPLEKQTNVSTWHIWKTKCHRYEVVRSISKLNEGDNYFAVMKVTEQTNKKKIIRNDLRTLNASLLCAEHDLQEISNADILTNDMTTLVHAENNGLDRLPEISQGKGSRALEKSTKAPNNDQCGTAKSNEKGVTQVNLKESEARKLLTAVGMVAVEKCNAKRLASKVNGLPSVHEELKQPEDSTDKAMLQNVLDALQEGTKIVIVPDEVQESSAEESKESNVVVVTKKTVTTVTKTDDAGNKSSKSSKKTSQPKVEKTTKTKPAKAAASVAKEKTPKAAKAEKTKPEGKKEASGERDKFGSRVGSNLAKINSCFSAKPKTIGQLAEEAGRENMFFRKHLKHLVEAGHVVKVEDGYRLPPKK